MRFLVITAVPLIAVSACASVDVDLAVSAARSSTNEWPHWRGPERSGVSAETNWLAEGAEAPLWSRSIGRGYSSPSVAAGRVFTKGFDEEREVDVTWALDAETGDVLWTHEHPSRKWDNMHGGGTLTTPVFADGVVYSLSRLGKLYALQSTDGAVLWERQLVESGGDESGGLGSFGLPSSPVVIEGQLIVNAGRVFALDPLTGEPLWSTEDYGYSYATPEPFDSQGNSYLAVFNAKGLAVLERSSGKQRALHPWTSQYNVNSASPICFDGKIFISTGYNEIGCALLEFTGDALEVVWESRAMNSKMNGCVLFDGHLYGFDRGILTCLDLEGAEQWRERGLGTGSLIVAGGRLVVLSEDGELLVAPATPDGFEPTSRRTVFEAGPCWTTPILAGGRIYCRSAAGELVCLDHRSA